MDWKKLIEDKTGSPEDISLTRTVALGTSIILSTGFILVTWKKASWEWALAYPGGIILTFVPQLFLRMVQSLENIIRAWKGDGTGGGEEV